MKYTIIGLLAALALFVLAPRAAAHDPVVNTSPANGDTIAAPPAVVEIEFAAPPQSDPISGSIIGPDGASWLSAPVRVEGNRLLISMRADAPPGWYTVEFTVVATDGHDVSGTMSFEVAAPAAEGMPAQPSAPQAVESPGSDEGRSGCGRQRLRPSVLPRSQPAATCSSADGDAQGVF